MVTRLVIVGSATLAALAVLAVTLLWDSPETPTRPDERRITTTAPPPPNVDDGFTDVPDNPLHGRVATGEYFIERYTRGRLWQFFGKSVRPLPGGLSIVEQPGARIHMSPSRVLEIRADRGTFDAPDNQPRSGDFNDNVVLSLFDAPGDAEVQLDDPDQLRLRVYMDDVSFEQEIGQFETDGPVHLTGTRVDFLGTGMRLIYNQRRNRIEWMEIQRGQELRIRTTDPAAADRTTAPREEPAASNSQNPEAPSRRVRRQPPASVGDAAVSEPPTTAAASSRQPQFYRAIFHDNVRIDSPQAVITADRLEVIFNLDDTQQREQLLEQLGSHHPLHTRSIAQNIPKPPPTGLHLNAPMLTEPMGSAMLHLIAMSITQAMGIPGDSRPSPHRPIAPLPGDGVQATLVRKHPTMAPPSDDDVIITWTGQLLLVPEEQAPAELRGPHDQMLVLVGQPVRIDTARDERVAAARVEYFTDGGRVGMASSDTQAMVIDSPQLGVLRGSRLMIDQARGEGYVLGPGLLDTDAVSELRDADDAEQVAGLHERRTPTELTIRWSDRLDMRFHLRADAGGGEATEPFNRLRSLRTAAFRGNVEITHPLFALDADQVDLSLDNPDQTGFGRQNLTGVHAAGNVHARSRGEAQRRTLAIRSDGLTLDMGHVDEAQGRLLPSRMVAVGNVTATEPGQTLRSRRLDVALAPREAATTQAGAETADGAARNDADDATLSAFDRELVVTTMLAEQDVRIDMDERGVTVLASRLAADARTGQAELFGNDDAPARLMHDDGELAGGHLVLVQDSQQVNAVGPGSFVLLTRRGVEGGHDQPPTRLRITWQQAMRYDDAAGFAHFQGNTLSTTESARDRTRLSADDLRIEFILTEPEDAQTDQAAVPNEAEAHPLASQRQLRLLQATGEAVFVAESFDQKPADDARPLTRFRLDGPMILFENPQEQVQVVGPGSMLVEDYRPERKPEDAEEAEEVASPGVAMVGRGQSLFTWVGSLVLDAANNDMRIDEKVQMVHRSNRTQGVVQLDCRRLFADVESTGGISGWTQGSAPRPQLQAVHADGDVRILEATRTILTDHMHYDGATDSVLLHADRGRMTQVNDDRDARLNYSAEQIRWHLSTNRFEIIRPGAGRVPLRRGQ